MRKLRVKMSCVLTIRKSDGYINAHKLCQSHGKCLKDWLATCPAKRLVKELETLSEHSEKIDGGYVPAILIIHVATWSSPCLGLQVYSMLMEEVIRLAVSEN